MREHTGTPWRFDGDWYRIPTIFGADGKMVASIEKDGRESTPERAANAAFIIKAVNGHEALVDALRVARRYIDTVIINTPDKKKRRNFGECLRIIDQALRDHAGIPLSGEIIE